MATRSPVALDRASLLRRTYLTVAEVALLIDVPPKRVRHWCKIGAIPAERGQKRGHYLIRLATLRERHALSASALEYAEDRPDDEDD